MLFYIIFLLCIYFIIYIEYLEKNKIFEKIKYILIFIVAAIRFDVGYDYPAYYNMSLGWFVKRYPYTLNRLEEIPKLIHKIAIYFKEPQLTFILYSLITVYFFYKGIKQSKNPQISFIYIFSFFYLMTLTIPRFGVALSVVFYSYKYLLKKEAKKYVVCIIFASLFHKTALIAIFFYIFQYFKLNKKTEIILILSSFLLPKIINKLFKKYGVYVFYLDTVSSGGKKMLIVWIIFVIFISVFRQRITKNNPKINILINLNILGLFFNIILFNFVSAGVRIGSLCYISAAYLIPYILNAFKKYEYKKLMFCIICGTYFLINIYIGMLGKKSPYTPYKIYFLQNEIVFKME